MRKYISIFCCVTVFIVCIGYLFLLIGYPLSYRDEINKNAKKYGIAPALIASLINTESSFNKNVISPKGAVGLMQILPSTAMYIIGEEVNLFDAKINIAVGTEYLAYLYEKFEDITTALFAYNAGEGNVAKWLYEDGVSKLTVCPFPETNMYVSKVLNGVKFYSWRI